MTDEHLADAPVFTISYGGIPIRFFSLPTGAVIPREDVALALGCQAADDDLGPPVMTSTDVRTAAKSHGSAGVRFLKWLGKTIKKADLQPTPEGIEAGFVCRMLVPVKSASGKVLRLREELGLTSQGQEYCERLLLTRFGSGSPSLH